MRELIKKQLHSDKAPIVFISGSLATKQDLYLCQYEQNSILQGQEIPKGTYLLADAQTLVQLTRYIRIKTLSKKTITAHVLHYSENNTIQTTLDNSADIVVTPRLTGCTFVGELSTSEPTLLHMNQSIIALKEGASRIDQEAINDEIKKTMANRPIFTLKKSDYNFSDKEFHSATVIGFREGGSWNYYSQYTAYDEKTETHTIVRGKQSHSLKGFSKFWELLMLRSKTKETEQPEQTETAKGLSQ